MVKDNNFDVEKWLCSSVEIWAIKTEDILGEVGRIQMCNVQ